MIDHLLWILAERLEEEKEELADCVLQRTDIELHEPIRDAAISYMVEIKPNDDYENTLYKAGLIEWFNMAIKVVEEYKHKYMQ